MAGAKSRRSHLSRVERNECVHVACLPVLSYIFPLRHSHLCLKNGAHTVGWSFQTLERLPLRNDCLPFNYLLLVKSTLFPKHPTSTKPNTPQDHETVSNNHHWDEKATRVENNDLSECWTLAEVSSDVVSGLCIPWLSGMRKGWSHYLWVSGFAHKSIIMEEQQEDGKRWGRKGAEVCRKQYLPDKTGLLYTWTHSDCDYTDKACKGPSQPKSQPGLGGACEVPAQTPS